MNAMPENRIEKITNLLVTGGCGFMGSNFIRYLLNESDYTGSIVNLDKLTYTGNYENLIDIESKFPEKYTFIKGDICDEKLLHNIFKDLNINSVCHFAAESHVDRSIADPDEFINTNIFGTYQLLKASKDYLRDLTLFHHVSTDEVYGSLGSEGYFTEDTPYKPNSPYSASKASSDHIVRAFYKTFNVPVTISNSSNNYGPYQFPEKLIPLTILNAMEVKEIPIYGKGENVRDWVYVDDNSKAIWLIIKKGKIGESYNIGGNAEYRNLKIAHLICDLIDELKVPKGSNKKRKNLIRFVKDRPGHDERYAIDYSKLQDSLGWEPEESFNSGILKTTHWYLNNKEWIEAVKSGEYRRWIDQQYQFSSA